MMNNYVFINLYKNEHNVEMVESFCGLKKEEVYSTRPLFHPQRGNCQINDCIMDVEDRLNVNLDRIYIIPKGENINYFKRIEEYGM